MVDEQGYLSSFYPPQKSNTTSSLKDFTYYISPGRGLFYFKSDYSYVSGGNTAEDGPYHYIMVTDRETGNISITDGTTKTEIADINIIKPDFYVHNNIVRIGNSEGVALAGGQKWFGPIGNTTGKSLLGITYDKRWVMMENFLEPPFWGLVGRCIGDSKTMADVQSISAPVKSELVGTSTIADDSGDVEFTASSHGLSVGDTVIISDSEYYSGSHTITAVDDANTFKIGKTWLSVASDETPEWRRKGEPDWFGGWSGTVGASVARGDAGVDNADNSHHNYVVWINESTDELRILDSLIDDNQLSIRTNATNSTNEFKVYPPRTSSATGEVLAGMNLDIYQSSGSDKGAWPPGEYEFGQTFVYEGNQESLIGKLHGNNLTIDANEVIYVRVLISGIRDVADTVPFTSTNKDLDPRLIGGRIYTRKAGTGDNWILLLDADFRTTDATSNRDLAGGGTRLNLTDKYDYWYANTAGSGDTQIWDNFSSNAGVGADVAKWIGFYSTQYTINSPSPFTYEAINGFSQEESGIGFGAYQTQLKYQTSVICNSRVFVANIKYYDTRNQSSSITKMGDAIIYSPPNKMDTFPASNRLDIAEGDGDEFTCLMESGGMLLAFKESTLYIVDVKNPNPAGWRLQGKFDGLGVKGTHSAVKIQSAVAFANNYGCWIYDNGQIQNLIERKISVSQWQNWTRSKFRKGNFTSTTTDVGVNKLLDSAGTFKSDKSNIIVGDIAIHVVDGTTANITTINSDTELTIDNDIFDTGEDYYIESNTFGPNIGYDNISKKLIIVNDCQNISDSPRFYDLVTGAWTRDGIMLQIKQVLL
jgi:hypothetical protein